MQTTPIRGPNAFAQTLYFTQVSRDRWSNHATSDYEGRRLKCTSSNCIVCIPFILSGSPNECWLCTCDACVITTWIRPRAGGWCDCSGGSTRGGSRGPAPPLIIFWRPGPLLISGSGLPAPHFCEGLDLPLDRYHICLSFLK